MTEGLRSDSQLLADYARKSDEAAYHTRYMTDVFARAKEWGVR